MLCEFCRANEATDWLVEHLDVRRGLPVACCPACGEARASNRPIGGRGVPRPTLTLRLLMVLVALFAIPNALVAWVVRPEPRLGETAEQLERWNTSAFLTVNACCGIAVAYVLLAAWLREVARYRRTRGWRSTPMSEPKPISGYWNLTALSFWWLMLTYGLGRRLADILGSSLRSRATGFGVVAVAIVVWYLDMTWRNAARRPMLEAAHLEWRRASAIERGLKVLAISGPITLGLVIAVGMIPFDHWLVVPGLLAVVLGYRLIFAAGEALMAGRS